MSRQPSTEDGREDTPAETTDRAGLGPELSVDEAVDLYANEWIFMAITERDERGHPTRCIVLDHHPRERVIEPNVLKTLLEVKAAGKAPEGVLGYQVVYGVRLFRTTAEWLEYQRQTEGSRGGHGGGRYHLRAAPHASARVTRRRRSLPRDPYVRRLGTAVADVPAVQLRPAWRRRRERARPLPLILGHAAVHERLTWRAE